MTRLERYDPFTRLLRFQNAIHCALGEPSSFEASRATTWVPTVDVYEDAERMTFKFDVPGVSKEDLNVKVDKGVLTLEGNRKLEFEERKENYHRIERDYGSFARSFSLPNTISADPIAAELKDGILRVTLTKKPEAQTRTIEIQ